MEHDCVLPDLLTEFLFDQIFDVNQNLTGYTKSPVLIIRWSDATEAEESSFNERRRAQFAHKYSWNLNIGWHANITLVFNTYVARCTARILVGVGVPRFVEKPDHEWRTLWFCPIRQNAPWVYASLCIHSGCVFDILFLLLKKKTNYGERNRSLQKRGKEDPQSVYAFLHQLADRLTQNRIILRRGEEEFAPDFPNKSVLELRIEEQEKNGKTKHTLEIEIGWINRDEFGGAVTLC
jgi:amphi-Trp domain-containing protein